MEPPKNIVDTRITAVRRIQVWDLPTRIFHWLLVALVITSFVTAAIGGNAMQYHERCGYTILALLLFRIVWGFAGGRPSRFSSFVRGPAVVVKYVLSLFGRNPVSCLGHNPLGGWSVIAMLLALLVQAGTGLFANDEIMTQGPLFALVSNRTSNWLTGIHTFNAGLIVLLVSIHVCAIFFYLLFKGENLIMPMITGVKQWSGNYSASVANPTWTAVVIAALAAVAVYLLVRLGSQ
jgi:cytochrome b